MALAGTDLGMRPATWRPWHDAMRRQALAQAWPLYRLMPTDPAQRSAVEEAVACSGRQQQPERLRCLPLLARRSNWAVLLDAEDGRIVGFAPLDVP